MPEETIEQTTPETENQSEETVVNDTPDFNPFDENQPAPEQKTNVHVEQVAPIETAATGTETAETKTEEETEEIVDANEYLKQNLGFDDWETAKTAFAELKELKEKAQTPAEIKFANEQSKLIHEYLTSDEPEAIDKVYEFLDTQKKLAAVDKMDASAAIKLKIQHDNKHFKPADVADVFEERYDIPEKPEQKIDELDDEYASRVAKWESKVEKVNRRIERDAVTAKAELSKLRSELVLPNISKKQEEVKQPEISQEELDSRKAFNESYLKSVEATVKNFNGFSVTSEDKDVKIPLSYNLSEDQKKQVAQTMSELAAANFDLNVLLAPRWVKEDKKTLNTDTIARDIARMLFGDQIEQKFANDASAKRNAEKIKESKNISLKSQKTAQETFVPQGNKTDMDKVAEFFFQQ